MHKSYPTRLTTTDGFIRTPTLVRRKHIRLMAVRKQPAHLISDTVIQRQSSAENWARLVFYSELAKQSQPTPSKAYSLTETPVGHDLTTELFANEIESRFQRGLDNKPSDTVEQPASFTAEPSHRGLRNHLSRARQRFF
jgi:hypothetical protein